MRAVCIAQLFVIETENAVQPTLCADILQWLCYSMRRVSGIEPMTSGFSTGDTTAAPRTISYLAGPFAGPTRVAIILLVITHLIFLPSHTRIVPAMEKLVPTEEKASFLPARCLSSSGLNPASSCYSQWSGPTCIHFSSLTVSKKNTKLSMLLNWA